MCWGISQFMPLCTLNLCKIDSERFAWVWRAGKWSIVYSLGKGLVGLFRGRMDFCRISLVSACWHEIFFTYCEFVVSLRYPLLCFLLYLFGIVCGLWVHGVTLLCELFVSASCWDCFSIIGRAGILSDGNGGRSTAFLCGMLTDGWAVKLYLVESLFFEKWYWEGLSNGK